MGFIRRLCNGMTRAGAYHSQFCAPLHEAPGGAAAG